VRVGVSFYKWRGVDWRGAKAPLFFVFLLPQKAMEEDFDQPNFLDQEKLARQEEKIESGKIVCNKDNPEECENCGG
tara:strand:- start:1191 stop:1418 length:228 start_codon:yes stop_codon:yes gene_type:complete